MESLTSTVEQSLAVFEGGVDWEVFFSEYFLKKPVLYKSPFGGPPFDERTIFEVLKRYQLDLANSRKRHIQVFNKNRSVVNGFFNSRRNNLGVHRLLPNASHADFGHFIRELTATEGYEEFCIYVQDANTDDEIWKITRSVLRELLPYAPLPPGKITCDFFIGNYAKTSFGAHKDPVDNLMFMISGKRTMLMWDDDTWKNQLGNPPDDTHIVLDYEKFRSASMCCTLEPGDLLYWPARCWHVGENNELSASFNVDFDATDQDVLKDLILRDALAEAVKMLGKQLYADAGRPSEYHTGRQAETELPTAYSRVMHQMQAALFSRNLDKELTSGWLKKNTSYGQLTAPRKRQARIYASTRLFPDGRYPVMYAVTGGTLLVSHSGHALSGSCGVEAGKAIIEYLNQSAGFTPAELVAALDRPDAQLDVVLPLLAELYSIHAIETEEPGR